MKFQHQELAAGRWQEFSLAEQFASVGSEIGRAIRWRGSDRKLYESALGRGRELLDLTIRDARWKGRLKELTRLREIFNDAVLGGATYGTRLEDLDRYFFHFAVAARNPNYRASGFGKVGALIALAAFALIVAGAWGAWYVKQTTGQWPLSKPLPDQLITVTGKVLKKDAEPLTRDGDGVLRLRGETGERVTVLIPSGETRCEAAGALGVFQQVKIGDTVEAFGLGDESSVMVCDSPDHYLRVVRREGVVCTKEAKLCPDGKTSVSRAGPNCEFALCPGEIGTSNPVLSEVEGWKTYRNEQYGFEFRYPSSSVLVTAGESVRFWENQLQLQEGLPATISVSFAFKDLDGKTFGEYVRSIYSQVRTERYFLEAFEAGPGEGLFYHLIYNPQAKVLVNITAVVEDHRNDPEFIGVLDSFKFIK